jgi:hypothetical protein
MNIGSAVEFADCMIVGLSEIIAGLRKQGKEALKSFWSAECPLSKCELNKAQGSMPSDCCKYNHLAVVA